MTLEAAFFAYQAFVILYFAAINLIYGCFGYIGLRHCILYARELSDLPLIDILKREIYRPVSVLVPAYNEQASIVASVSSLLSMRYPEFEVVVVSDGSTDGTLAQLQDAFALVEEDRSYRRVLTTEPVRAVYRSLRNPNLVVIDKINGGKADALNAALNLARYPLVCAVDADSLLDADAVLRASRLFVEDESLVAIGGTVRPLNAAVLEDGRVSGVRLPKTWMERFQTIEYARAFFTGRAGWSSLGALLIISGAFGLFRREAVLAAGGYSTNTVCEDMELVLRLHKSYRASGIPYRIAFVPDPICWTEVPSDVVTLRRQRNRWHRGLCETLWMHKDMFFNPRYGRLGMLGVPYFWLFEAIAPAIEILGYISLPIAWGLGVLSTEMAMLFTILAVLYGMLLSQLSVGIETFLLARYPRLRDRCILFAAAFLEYFGYRQMLSLERTVSIFQILGKRGQWGTMQRRGIPAEMLPSGPCTGAETLSSAK